VKGFAKEQAKYFFLYNLGLCKQSINVYMLRKTLSIYKSDVAILCFFWLPFLADALSCAKHWLRLCLAQQCDSPWGEAH
tara:strand:- start:189 stop:425 length:237 start_codon:yes stop_codon:yes gene_type:complete